MGAYVLIFISLSRQIAIPYDIQISMSAHADTSPYHQTTLSYMIFPEGLQVSEHLLMSYSKATIATGDEPRYFESRSSDESNTRDDYCTVHKVLTFIRNATSYQEVPVVLCGHYSAMRNQVANNDTSDVICDDDHQYDWGRILTDLLPPW
ncbi:hypothetical protein TNCV_4491911 [Trichonephila clavipes]|nr:hypothetical protein TNCV_4491911 [Trichonephila clavipes]